jgi:hypothetical protein
MVAFRLSWAGSHLNLRPRRCAWRQGCRKQRQTWHLVRPLLFLVACGWDRQDGLDGLANPGARGGKQQKLACDTIAMDTSDDSIIDLTCGASTIANMNR